MVILQKILSTFFTILKIILKSDPFLKKEDFSNKNFILLGNGPTLENDLKEHTELFRRSRIITVNNFLYSPYFQILEPEYYFILDPAYFSEEPSEAELISRFLEGMQQVSWSMSLYIPARYRRSYLARSVNNPNITIRYYNYVTCKGGFDAVNFAFYNRALAFPQCQNVLNGALFMFSRNRAGKIFLFGAENDWHLKYRINEKNQVYFVYEHFFNTGGTYKLLDNNLASYLESSAKALRSYLEIERYARSSGTRIYNCSSNSMIDAFERISKEEFLRKIQES
ncbi:MAG: hypothetical protein IBJ09_11275 [Bacteroidia bacterium]|nr:hypothetical protein [Bacteroidia bacterium]